MSVHDIRNFLSVLDVRDGLARRRRRIRLARALWWASSEIHPIGQLTDQLSRCGPPYQAYAIAAQRLAREAELIIRSRALAEVGEPSTVRAQILAGIGLLATMIAAVVLFPPTSTARMAILIVTAVLTAAILWAAVTMLIKARWRAISAGPPPLNPYAGALSENFADCIRLQSCSPAEEQAASQRASALVRVALTRADIAMRVAGRFRDHPAVTDRSARHPDRIGVCAAMAAHYLDGTAALLGLLTDDPPTTAEGCPYETDRGDEDQ